MHFAESSVFSCAAYRSSLIHISTPHELCSDLCFIVDIIHRPIVLGLACESTFWLILSVCSGWADSFFS